LLQLSYLNLRHPVLQYRKANVSHTNVGSQIRSVPSSEHDATITDSNLMSSFLSFASSCFSCHSSTSTIVAQSIVSDSASYIQSTAKMWPSDEMLLNDGIDKQIFNTVNQNLSPKN